MSTKKVIQKRVEKSTGQKLEKIDHPKNGRLWNAQQVSEAMEFLSDLAKEECHDSIQCSDNFKFKIYWCAPCRAMHIIKKET